MRTNGYVDGVQPVLRLPEGHRTGGSTSKACARGCCPRTTCRGCGTSRPGSQLGPASCTIRSTRTRTCARWRRCRQRRCTSGASWPSR